VGHARIAESKAGRRLVRDEQVVAVSHQVGDPALEHPMDHVDRLTQELGLAIPATPLLGFLNRYLLPRRWRHVTDRRNHPRDHNEACDLSATCAAAPGP
jgi:hypothetical protein